MFDPRYCISPASFWSPIREGHDSGWAEHAPFAFWLIEALRPKVVVELGVYKGYSYAVFCQAVRELQLDTRCYGVDTWMGDEHAGFFPAVIYDDLSAHINSHYSGFSRLIRSTFDEALQHFADGSIDLLHIDGRHFYEDVVHDFSSWKSKLAPNAVVLFHDTNVREHGFGVFRLWDELKTKYRNFEFLHGNGLGVLALGEMTDLGIRSLFELNGSDVTKTRAAYSHLGRAITDRYAIVALRAEKDMLVAEAEERQLAAERQLGAAGQHVAEAKTEVERAQRQAAESEQLLNAIEMSTTWRLTRPLRAIGERFPFLALSLRRSIKLAWWTVTLQLPRRYRLWCAYRQLQLYQPTTLPAEPPTLLPSDIRIQSSHEPVVSVVISTYGQISVTLACLQSIATHSPRNPIEVIVVDDAYPGPEDVRVLRDVIGIRLIRNDSNLGFLRSCNLASRTAKGRYIYMLNNDTELQHGSIDALVELLDARPNAGMVGSKLLFPDGRLQEAGGIIWDDASGWNYGRGDNPSRPEYNYVREVDYCSAASIMVRRTLFESLGGFNDDFAPAYYEDVDLAFRIRKQGMTVLYEPRSIIIHHEGMSHGTDVSTGVKAYQTINQTRLMESWGAILSRENYPNGQHVLRARDRAPRRKVILIIDHYTAEPDRDAGSRSVVGIIDSLVDAGWVVKYWPHMRTYSPVYATALERRGVEVLDDRWPGDLDAWLRDNGGELDHLLVVRPDIATSVLPHIMRNNDAVHSFYGVDLHFARLRRQANLEGNSKLLEEAAEMERLERRVWRNFDLVIYPSEEEAVTVRATSPHTLARGIVPFCFDTFPASTVPPEGHNILFVAGFSHPPNVDAAVFLIREVIPRLEHEIGPVNVVLAGSNPTETVRTLAGPTVSVTGYVTDEELGKLYARHRVSVVPLRFGAGVKGKVVEALSRGLPLVTTSIGSQGIPALGEIVPVRDDVPGLVAALQLLLVDDAAWLTQSAAQVDFAQRFFSRTAMQRSVLSALEDAEMAAGRIGN